LLRFYLYSYNTGKRKVYAVDAFACGPYELLGHQHELKVGVNYTRQDNKYFSTFEDISSASLGNYNAFNGQYAESVWTPRQPASDTPLARQKSTYMATRLSPADPLHLIFGARSTNWNRETPDGEEEQNNTTLQMTVGSTRYIAENRDGSTFNPQLLQTSFNLFSSYRLPMLQLLTLGGGVNWQTRVWHDVVVRKAMASGGPVRAAIRWWICLLVIR